MLGGRPGDGIWLSADPANMRRIIYRNLTHASVGV